MREHSKSLVQLGRVDCDAGRVEVGHFVVEHPDLLEVSSLSYTAKRLPPITPDMIHYLPRHGVIPAE